MTDLTLLTLILVFTMPLLGTVLTLISKKEYHRWICSGVIALVMLGLIMLGLGGEVDIETAWSFMDEPITFSISSTALWLYMATLVVLIGLIGFSAQDDDKAMTPYQWALLNLALAFGFIAFVSGQFMIRYIALDIVGLLAALTVLSTFSATLSLRHFILIFQILRLGDLSLLASILLINHMTGTLEISQMITAVVDMPANVQTWIFLGFFLALLIKMAIWPFGIWLKRAHQSAPRISFWASGLLLPVLGFYLLYRIIPIIQSASLFQYLTLYTSLVLGLLIILFTALRQVRFDRFTLVGGFMSCFLLAAAAFGNGQMMLYYLLGLILHRWLILFSDQQQVFGLELFSALFPLLVNGLFIIFNLGTYSTIFLIGWSAMTALMVVWDVSMQRKLGIEQVFPVQNGEGLLSDELFGGYVVKAARWLNQTLELGILTHGIARMSDFFLRIADWVYHNIEMGMEALWIGIGRKLVQISEGTLRKVEVDSAQTAAHWMEDGLESLAIYEQKIKHKALRRDLAWIPFLLVVILIMLFVM